MKDDFRTYLFRYSHGGSSWGIEIKAESPEDAMQRLSKLAFATYQGEVVAKLPMIATTPARAVVAIRNAGRRIKELLAR
jgi:hypothetical protein